VSATFSPTFNASEAGADLEVNSCVPDMPDISLPLRKDTEVLADSMKPALELPPLEETGPTEEEIVEMLRTTESDTASFRQINLYFHSPPGTEHIRRVVESRPQSFSVHVDKVTLRDPAKKEALNRLVRELVRPPLSRKQIKPDEACEPVACAAVFALRACPQDVAKILMNVAKNTLRKTADVRKGTYPANMPLVIACLVDCIVTNERKQGVSKRFENCFSPLIYQMIFQRWVLGSIPGSQFLANLLVTWERSGYFQAKHIEECKKPLWLLVAYAKADGVPDSPDKENRAGWYKVVRREPGFTAGAEAICPPSMAQQQVECESVLLESAASRTLVASEVSSTAPTEQLAAGAKAGGTIGARTVVASSAGHTEAPAAAPASPGLASAASFPTEVMGPPAAKPSKRPHMDAVSVATSGTQEIVTVAPTAAGAEKDGEKAAAPEEAAEAPVEAEEPKAKRARTDEPGEPSAQKPE